jgi:hypothetical protein
MKFPRFTLRTMLIAVAMIAAVVGWLRYESQRGWTVAKVERLVKAEVNPDWNPEQFEEWVQRKGFGLFKECVSDSSKQLTTTGFRIGADQGANLGLFRGRGAIYVDFNLARRGRCEEFTVSALSDQQ